METETIEINDLLQELVARKGSDLHLITGLVPAVRISSGLVPLKDLPVLTNHDLQKMIYSILTAEQIETFETGATHRYELDFAHSVPGLGRFRFNVYKQRSTIAVAARSLAETIPELETLGLPPGVAKLTQAKKGLTLVTGATGSGKSTTLAAIIDRINSTRADHILTIEDPIEYLHNTKKSYISQREVGHAADTLSFTMALKYALRQDPDVILIGEMRDVETISIALTAAETGHYVLGTLHTSSSPQTISRVIDSFPSDQQHQVITQLGSSLYAVLCQVLLPKAEGGGRKACAELMLANSAIRNLIRSNNIDGMYQSMQTGGADGMVTMDQSIADAVIGGTVKYEVAKPFIRDEVTHRRIIDALRVPGNHDVYEGNPRFKR